MNPGSILRTFKLPGVPSTTYRGLPLIRSSCSPPLASLVEIHSHIQRAIEMHFGVPRMLVIECSVSRAWADAPQL
jgi:hypothetical protein